MKLCVITIFLEASVSELEQKPSCSSEDPHDSTPVQSTGDFLYLIQFVPIEKKYQLLYRGKGKA